MATALVVVVVLAVAYQEGLLHLFSDPVRLKQTLLDLGPWGYVAFVLGYAALQPFGVPGTIFVVAAPLIWPWPVAFCLSMVGTMAASVLGFTFARFVARDWVAARIPVRFRAYDEALAKRAFFTVFTLRLVFWMPPLLHAFFGVSQVSFWTHFWGSLAGYVLPLLLVSYFGQRILDWLQHVPLEWWLLLGVSVLLLVSLALWLRRRAIRRGVR